MRTTESLNPFIRPSYALLLGGLVVGVVAAPFNLKVGLVPAVLVFGWSEIGGL
jgi:hypothetical protein